MMWFEFFKILKFQTVVLPSNVENYLPQTPEGALAANNPTDLPRSKSPLGDLGVASISGFHL